MSSSANLLFRVYLPQSQQNKKLTYVDTISTSADWGPSVWLVSVCLVFLGKAMCELWKKRKKRNNSLVNNTWKQSFLCGYFPRLCENCLWSSNFSWNLENLNIRKLKDWNHGVAVSFLLSSKVGDRLHFQNWCLVWYVILLSHCILMCNGAEFFQNNFQTMYFVWRMAREKKSHELLVFFSAWLVTVYCKGCY